MELVAQDIGGAWYYEDGVYWCINANGDRVGKIAAEYIPDPVKLWQSKCDAAGVHISSPDAKKLKSNEVIYKLWEYNANLYNEL